jgi:hypothetical protein
MSAVRARHGAPRITWTLAGERNIDLAVDVKTETVQVRIMVTFGLVTQVTYPNLTTGAKICG